jgi:hypothetical protein
MPIVPKKITDKVSWYQQRTGPWTTNNAAIGLLPAETTAMTAKVTAAAAALTAHQAAQNAAKAATVTLYDAIRDMGDYGATLINKIKAKAGQDGNGVYALALLPPPPTPTPVGAPGTPFQLKVTLNPDGSLELTWKCENPTGAGGTLYHVYRRTGAVGAFDFIGGAGTRKYTDLTVPSSVASVTYKIQAARTTVMGLAAEFIVNFGVSSGGTMTASVVEGPTGPKMAA